MRLCKTGMQYAIWTDKLEFGGGDTLGFRSPNLRQRTFGSGAFRPALAKNDPLDHFSGAAGPLDSQRANQLELKTKLVSVSLVTVAKRVPGQKEQEKNPEKSSSFDFFGFFSCSAVRFAHRAASEAGLARGLPARPPLKTGPRAGFPGATGPGTVAGVKARWRKNQQHLRQKRRFSASLLTQKRSVPLPSKSQFAYIIMKLCRSMFCRDLREMRPEDLEAVAFPLL